MLSGSPCWASQPPAPLYLLEMGTFGSLSSELHQKLLHLQVRRHTWEGGEIFRFDFIEMHDSP